MKRVLLNRFVSDNRVYIVICEAQLIAKRLDKYFYVNPKYFGGVETDLSLALATAMNADHVTLLGNEVVKRALSLGICDPASIRRIGGTMYAEVVKV